MMKPLLIAGVLMAAGMGAGAQGGLEPQAAQDAGVASAAPPFEFAGFTVPGLGEAVELRFKENANGVMYGVDIHRSRVGDPHRYADVTPLARFSQTIAPIAEIGTVDDLLTAVVNDARQVMQSNSLNDSLGETSACTRTIMGEPRPGKRFDAVLSHDTLMAPEPVKGHVECYAFEHEGKGVAVILRVAESDKRAMEDDARDLDALLAGIGFRPVGPMSPYTYELGGYPIGLPVGSRVMSVEHPNESTLTARVVLDSVSLNLMLMRVPEQIAPEASFVQIERSYEEQIRATVAKSNGGVNLLWKSSSAIPAGRDRLGLIDAPVYMLSAKGGKVYSAFYKNLEGDMLLSGVFTASPANADKLHADARVFVDALRGGRYDLAEDAWTVRLPAGSITMDPSLRAVAMMNDSGESGGIDATLITVGPGVDAESVFRSLLTHHAFTAVRSAPSEGEEDLMDWHARLVDRVRGLGRGDDADAGERASREDGGWRISTVQVAMAPNGEADGTKGAAQAMDVMVSTRVIPGEDGTPGALVSAVSPVVLGSDARAMAAQLGGMIEPVSVSGRLGLGFGELAYDPGSMLVTSEHREARHERHTWFTLNGDRVDVFTTDPDGTLDVLSDRMLAERYVHGQWNLLAYDDEEDLYPEQGEGLDRVTIAGHDGVGMAVRLAGADEEAGRKRSQPIGAGVFGFRHGDQYTTIVIKQLGGYDKDGFGRVLKMFRVAP